MYQPLTKVIINNNSKIHYIWYHFSFIIRLSNSKRSRITNYIELLWQSYFTFLLLSYSNRLSVVARSFSLFKYSTIWKLLNCTNNILQCLNIAWSFASLFTLTSCDCPITDPNYYYKVNCYHKERAICFTFENIHTVFK